jgi:hypothetical protein
VTNGWQRRLPAVFVFLMYRASSQARNDFAPLRIAQLISAGKPQPINLYRWPRFLLECAVAETPLSL